MGAKQTIISRPGIHGGKPIVSGTRITVAGIQRVAKEWTIAQILKSYPSLTPEGLAAALTYKLPAKNENERWRKAARKMHESEKLRRALKVGRWSVLYLPGTGEAIHYDGAPTNLHKLVCTLNRAGVELPGRAKK